MIALSTQGITLSFGTDVILKDISFAVNDGERVGIIGVNGAGKTSLFKLITGEYEADSGAVYIQKGHTVGMLEQNPDLTALPSEMSCLEYMYTAHPELLTLEEEISRIERMLRSAGEDAMALSARLEEENRRYAAMGGLEFRSRCRGMLMRLGFGEELIERVELKDLNARDAVDLFRRDDARGGGGHTDGAYVTVVNGVVDQMPFLVDETEVHTPGVDTDGIKAAGVNRLGDALLDLVE